jgi:L-fucose isomerase-like protein
MYIALKQEIEKDETIRGAGMNCLNESFYSDTTPCLAWDMLFEEKGLIWACEADTMVLTTKYIVHKALDVPIMMSNIYPFLMGMAALKHEKIEKFPEVEDPSNHFLVAHCGYLGVVPKSFSTEWTLRSKVLSIVDDNATAIDARLPVGALTLTKLDPTLSRLMVVEGLLEGYAQYPGSDCRNGAIVRVQNARELMNKFYSHHYLLVTGHKRVEMELLAKVMDLEIDKI